MFAASQEPPEGLDQFEGSEQRRRRDRIVLALFLVGLVLVATKWLGYW